MSTPYSHPFYRPKEKFITANGIQLCYEALGDPKGEPLVMIMGLGTQMTAWPPELLEPILEEGFRIIRFDNRDIGKSQELEFHQKVPAPIAYLRTKLGLKIDAPYLLHDMAEDTAALLKSLDIQRAHVLGISMGGMIAQLLANHAEIDVLSLSLLMTSNNHPKLPSPDLNTLWRINGGGIRGHDQESALKRGLAFWDTVKSPGFATPKDRILQRIARDYQRSYRPMGVVRQMRAIMATGSIEDYSKAITAPTLILHGSVDPLVKPKAAHWLKENIPHANLDMIPGWGHDLPLSLLPRLAHKITSHMKASTHNAFGHSNVSGRTKASSG
ncbi:alpha/beta hydrolase [Hahella sp. CCB-MM4]|uniref:alpha/beta fold hydrolase n=1 Tax=Hahella sp. (strain CCB-MM4) TaxID=1926491 RepID=UPI000B9B74B3|nr:alpha/beta hydrolase [Hahella sp. CCB-MM4]OZG74530.1 alpha/beta hydrolase [Hahella sp. CCB-MM4]